VVAVLVDTLALAVLVVAVLETAETAMLVRHLEPQILAVVAEAQFMVVLCTAQMAQTVALVL